MKKKEAKEYESRNYTFRVELKAVPQAIWDTANKMNAIWNGLVYLHKQVSGDIETRTIELDKAVDKALIKSIKKELYAPLTKRGVGGTGYDFVSIAGPQMKFGSCWQYWLVYEKWRSSMQAFAKGVRGAPKPHYGIKSVNIPFVADSNSVPFDWVFGSPKRAFHLEHRTDGRTPELGHLKGSLRFIGVPLDFEMILHREIPEGTRINQISLIGEHKRPFGWEWHLQFGIRLPLEHCYKNTPASGKTASLDVGWRVRDTGLRFATLYDGKYEYELVLPFDLASHQDKRLQERLSKNGAPCEITRDIREVFEMESEQGTLLEEVKEYLQNINRSQWPDDAKELMKGIVKMRQKGIRKLMGILEKVPACKEVYLDLKAWSKRDSELFRRIRRAEIDIEASRNELYRIVAAWFAEQFDYLAIEADLSLKKMAEANLSMFTSAALVNGQKWRQHVSLSTFTRYLKEAFHARRKQLVPVAKETGPCALCGGSIQKGAKLNVVCDSGHEIDQDVNAAWNLYNRLPEEMRAVAHFPTSVDRSQIKTVIRMLNCDTIAVR